jgi:hypothetical protein
MCVKVGEGFWSFVGCEMVGIAELVYLLSSAVEGDGNTFRIRGSGYSNPLPVGFH